MFRNNPNKQHQSSTVVKGGVRTYGNCHVTPPSVCTCQNQPKHPLTHLDQLNRYCQCNWELGRFVVHWCRLTNLTTIIINSDAVWTSLWKLADLGIKQARIERGGPGERPTVCSNMLYKKNRLAPLLVRSDISYCWRPQVKYFLDPRLWNIGIIFACDC